MSERVRAARLELGLSQAALAGIAPCSIASIQNIEAGYIPRKSDVIPRILAALDAEQNNLDPAGNRAEGKASDATAHRAG